MSMPLHQLQWLLEPKMEVSFDESTKQVQLVCHTSNICNTYSSYGHFHCLFNLPGGLCRWGPGHDGLRTCWRHLPRRWRKPRGHFLPNLVRPYLGRTTTGHTAGLRDTHIQRGWEIKNASIKKEIQVEHRQVPAEAGRVLQDCCNTEGLLMKWFILDEKRTTYLEISRLSECV